MDAGRMTVRCVCGWETTGTEDEVVAATIAHGERLHNMTPTRDQVLAMTVRADGPDVPQEAARP